MVSVIIPMCNSSETIIKSLISIENQTAYNKIREIIVVDDGSDDNSVELVENYSLQNDRVPIILIQQSNKGVSSARNVGLKKAKSKWIALLDSDDEWLPNKIEIQLREIKKNDTIDFIGGNGTADDLKILGKKLDYLYKANIVDLCLKNFPPTPTALFKREIIDSIGFFDESQKYGEDMNYFNKICINFNYYHIQEQLVELSSSLFRKTHTGLSSNLKEMQKGNIKNIKELRKERNITLQFYLFLRIFYWLKYVRRIILWKL